MLISEFARQSDLSVDTVRFYIRRGLIEPDHGGKGGRHPYQVFTQEHVTIARFIKLAQSLGMSLREIAAINSERKRGGMTRERGLEIMRQQLGQIEQKITEFEGMGAYLRAKIAWMENGQLGPAPMPKTAPWRPNGTGVVTGCAA